MELIVMESVGGSYRIAWVAWEVFGAKHSRVAAAAVVASLVEVYHAAVVGIAADYFVVAVAVVVAVNSESFVLVTAVASIV